jgi:hypothetical protein
MSHRLNSVLMSFPRRAARFTTFRMLKSSEFCAVLCPWVLKKSGFSCLQSSFVLLALSERPFLVSCKISKIEHDPPYSMQLVMLVAWETVGAYFCLLFCFCITN